MSKFKQRVGHQNQISKVRLESLDTSMLNYGNTVSESHLPQISKSRNINHSAFDYQSTNSQNKSALNINSKVSNNLGYSSLISEKKDISQNQSNSIVQIEKMIESKFKSSRQQRLKSQHLNKSGLFKSPSPIKLKALNKEHNNSESVKLLDSKIQAEDRKKQLIKKDKKIESKTLQNNETLITNNQQNVQKADLLSQENASKCQNFNLQDNQSIQNSKFNQKPNEKIQTSKVSQVLKTEADPEKIPKTYRNAFIRKLQKEKLLGDDVIADYEKLLSQNIQFHSVRSKKAVFNEQEQIQLKTKPKNASLSYSPYILASAFSLDFYSLYRDQLNKSDDAQAQSQSQSPVKAPDTRQIVVKSTQQSNEDKNQEALNLLEQQLKQMKLDQKRNKQEQYKKEQLKRDASKSLLNAGSISQLGSTINLNGTMKSGLRKLDNSSKVSTRALNQDFSLNMQNSSSLMDQTQKDLLIQSSISLQNQTSQNEQIILQTQAKNKKNEVDQDTKESLRKNKQKFQIKDKNFKLNIFEKALEQKDLSKEQQQLLKEQMNQKPITKRIRNKDYVDKEFLNQIRYQRIQEIKKYKKSHLDLVSRLKGITDRRKVEKFESLDTVVVDPFETKQNSRILQFLIYDMNTFQKLLEEHGIEEKIIDEREANQAELIMDKIEEEEKNLEREIELRSKIKDKYVGGKGVKKITMEGQKEQFLATHLLDKSWFDMTKDNSIRIQEILNEIQAKSDKFYKLNNQWVSRFLELIETHKPNIRLRFDPYAKLQSRQDLSSMLQINEQDFHRQTLKDIVQQNTDNTAQLSHQLSKNQIFVTVQQDQEALTSLNKNTGKVSQQYLDPYYLPTPQSNKSFMNIKSQLTLNSVGNNINRNGSSAFVDQDFLQTNVIHKYLTQGRGKSMDKIQRFYQLKDILGKCNENLNIDRENNKYSILLRKMEDMVQAQKIHRNPSEMLSDYQTQSGQSRSISNLKSRRPMGRKLGAGSFGSILLGTDIDNGKYVAIKFEKSSLNKQPQLPYEAKVMRNLSQGNNPVFGVPKIHWLAMESEFNIMVMDLLGPSLADLFNYCSKKFSLKTTLMLADQMLQRIEQIHKKNYIHRDIKPDNFLMGLGTESYIVNVIDFGLSKKFRDAKSQQHIPYRENRNLTGTARYASLNAHLGIEQSRRDDLEAIGFCLIYFIQGKLPWQNLQANNRAERYAKIAEIKLRSPVEHICLDLPLEIANYMHYVRALRFEDRPDYQGIRHFFKKLLVKEGYEYDHLYDWVMINNQHLENIFTVESFDDLRQRSDRNKNLKTESVEGQKDQEDKEEEEELKEDDAENNKTDQDDATDQDPDVSPTKLHNDSTNITHIGDPNQHLLHNPNDDENKNLNDSSLITNNAVHEESNLIKTQAKSQPQEEKTSKTLMNRLGINENIKPQKKFLMVNQQQNKNDGKSDRDNKNDKHAKGQKGKHHKKKHNKGDDDEKCIIY